MGGSGGVGGPENWLNSHSKIDNRPQTLPLPLGHLAILRDRDSFVGREYQVIDVYEFQNENTLMSWSKVSKHMQE